MAVDYKKHWVLFDHVMGMERMKMNAKTLLAGLVALAMSHAATAGDIKVAVVGAMNIVYSPSRRERGKTTDGEHCLFPLPFRERVRVRVKQAATLWMREKPDVHRFGSDIDNRDRSERDFGCTFIERKIQAKRLLLPAAALLAEPGSLHKRGHDVMVFNADIRQPPVANRRVIAHHFFQ